MSNSAALRAAKQLTRQWPHAKPPDPEGWLQGISDTLRRYPPAVIEQCVESGGGLALVREFPPTCKAVADWCDERRSVYELAAAVKDWQIERQSRPAYVEPPENPEQAKLISSLLRDTARAIAANPAPSPLDRQIAERRDSLAMTRNSILERSRVAE